MDFPATAATSETLPNGLTLILDPSPVAPVVSAQVWVETGSIHEGPLLGSGLSHFLEHMVFKGGGRFGPSELAETVQAGGGHWNAYTTFDRTVYYIDGPALGLRSFLEVLAAMVFHPHLPESEFEKEKDVIRREIDMGLDDPDDRGHRLLFDTAFIRDARRQPVIGHRELFDQITYDDLRRYHATRYTPNRACLCLSGDFDPAEVRETILSLFGDLPRGMEHEPTLPSEPHLLSPRVGRATFAVPASRLTLAWQTPPAGHPDQPALDLAAAILGRGRSARLYRALREERPLALEISAWCWTPVGSPGLFAVSAEVLPEHRDELLAALRQLIAAFPSTALDHDLEKARRQIASTQIKTLTTVSGRATDLASNWHEARDLDHTRHYLQQLDRVTAADIRRALGNLLTTPEILTFLDPIDAPESTATARMAVEAPSPESFSLPNGTQVSLLADARIPLISLQAVIRAGAPAESSATAGINRLLAAALPHGTLRHDAAELALTLESLGASFGASAGNNSIIAQLSGLSGDLETLLPLFGEILCSPALPSDAIERERASQLATLQETQEDPLSLAFRNLRPLLFGESGYGLASLGTETSLAHLDRLALAAHHSLHFRGPNLTLALAGDFDLSRARELITAAFAGLEGGDPWLPAASKLPESGERLQHLAKKQAVLTLGYRGCAALDEDRHALRFLQEWCSDMAGPLFMRIREDLGLAYQVGATQFHGFDTGLFAFYLATDPSQLELARTELLKEISQLATQGIPEEAFERVRATVLSATALDQQSPASIARHAAIDTLFGLPATHHRELTGIYQALTPDEVRSAASRLLALPPCVSIVMPE
ncbi:zinc protease [Haloferula luteola]|uniref:Zinc protease n=1 Tax=Haloferula luteola TaxID=595692 RepID=A0A840VAP6_9BACT|nr:pitrilysin family protein [Haloferula luteola]MBB5352624.1 zinc protease [Haloferula luteola]